jgi:hypothetical protein
VNRYFCRLRAVWLLALGAGVLALALSYGPDALGQSGQSPVSPLPPLPWAPTPEPASWLGRVFSEAFWRSPLSWVAIGLVLFGTLAWVLVHVLRRVRRQADDREDPSGPSNGVQ